MELKRITKCGVPLDKLENGICRKCASYANPKMHCEVRREDIISERLYNFCKTHNCLMPMGIGINLFVYNEKRFLSYLKKNPSEIRKRKWLQEIAKEEKIDF